jgi:hypothetical protein
LERSITLKKQWGGLLTFVLIAVLSLPALGQQQAPAQAPAADSSGQAAGQASAAAPSTPQPAAESFDDGTIVNCSASAHV